MPHVTVPYMDVSGGLAPLVNPLLVKPNQWYQGKGVIFHNGYVENSPLYTTQVAASGSEILTAVTNPRDDQRALSTKCGGMFVAGVTKLYYLRYGVGGVMAFTEVTPATTAFRSSGTDELKFVHLADKIYCIGKKTPLFYVNTEPLVGSASNYYLVPNAPSGVDAVLFFNHLVTAGGSYLNQPQPSTARWSQLDAFETWGPTATNEADYFDLAAIAENADGGTNCNGLKRIGDTLYFFMDNCIIPCAYVGLPKVMRFGEPITEVGCTDKNSFASYQDECYFFSRVQGAFYKFSRQGLERLTDDLPLSVGGSGGSLWTFPPSRFHFTTYDPATHCIAWRAYGLVDYTLLYDVRRKVWSGINGKYPLAFQPVSNRRSFKHWGTDYTTIASLSTFSGNVIENLYIPQTPTNTYYLGGYVVGADLSIAAIRADSSGLPSTLQLVTGDRVYGSVTQQSELHGITIHGGCDGGIAVSVSARNNLGESVPTATSVGTWTSALPQKRLTFPPIRGRVFRITYAPAGAFTYFNIKAVEEHIFTGVSDAPKR